MSLLVRACCAAVAALPAMLPAQVVRPPGEEQRDPNRHPLAPRPVTEPAQGFQPLETVAPTFQGFPTFPPNLSGYGGYPRVPEGLLTPPDLGAGRSPPPLRPEPPDWPSWVRVAAKEALPYAPDKAVVLRDADRVWYRENGDESFVPLAFYDKSHSLAAGSEVQVRGVGEFQVLFHGGSRIRSFGRAHLTLGEMSEAKLEFYVNDFSELAVFSRARPAWLHLPDGNVVVTEIAENKGCDLALERDGQRGYLVNHGPNLALLRTPWGDIELPASHRVTVFLVGPGPVYSGPLRHDGGVSIERQGRRLRATAASGGGVLEWSGARIRVPEGAVLELDALQGGSFPDGAAGSRD